MPEVALVNLSKIYSPGIPAVDALNLQVHDSELLVLVGPSGCGKTTTLRLIAGLEEPSSGAVHIGGRAVTRLPPAERDVALLFQRPALYPNRNVRGNLGASVALRQRHGWLRRFWSARQRHEQQALAERVASTAELLGLESLLDRQPHQLSGGQQQRVALGRALVREAALILLDEPLANLDAGLRHSLRRELHLLQRDRRATMVVVTHDPVEALGLGDRVAVMERGRLVQVDTPDAVFRRPVNRFVAGFIGWPAMNFIDGELHRAGERLEFLGCAGRLAVPDEVAQAWSPWMGVPLTLGIRPEDVSLVETATPSSWLMSLRLVESLGHSQLVSVACRGCEMTAWVREGCQTSTKMDTMAAERKVMVHLSVQNGCLFDRATGAALAVRATG